MFQNCSYRQTCAFSYVCQWNGFFCFCNMLYYNHEDEFQNSFLNRIWEPMDIHVAIKYQGYDFFATSKR